MILTKKVKKMTPNIKEKIHKFDYKKYQKMINSQTSRDELNKFLQLVAKHDGETRELAKSMLIK